MKKASAVKQLQIMQRCKRSEKFVITNIHKVDEITQSPLYFHSNFTANLPLQCSFDVIFLHTLSTTGMFFCDKLCKQLHVAP